MILKDFQKATADRIVRVFRGGQNRVLLADEVGLGKTIIARDVIRQVSKWHKVEKKEKHFKVIYICSNINIANQNARKLGIQDLMNVSESRLSMQHLKIYQNRGVGQSFEQLIPLTPATSFSMTSGCGNQEERALMYVHLRRLPVFKNYTEKLSIFLAYEAKKHWRDYVEYYEQKVVECNRNKSNYLVEMSKELKQRLGDQKDLIDSIKKNCVSRSPSKKYESRPMINALRKIFAQISLDKLEPNLVIMDEFQRFRDLITYDDNASSEQELLSRQFLNNPNIKVLLLSATPYKPYSTLEEISEDEDTEHYKEFMEVMDFLFYGSNAKKSFQKIWHNYSSSLNEISKGNFTILIARKNSAEDELYKGICRTERFNTGIIDDSQAAEIEISEGDIFAYSEMQSLLDQIKTSKKSTLKYRNVPIDYVKSSPYLLSFMESYILKRQIEEFFSKTGDYTLVKGPYAKRLLLKKSTIHHYDPIASNNARLEKLKEVVFQHGKNNAENLLWIPPSNPYYMTGSIFDKNRDYSKVLLFSSWEMVPRMIAVMLSYEAERLTIGKLFHDAKIKRGRGYFASREERRFGISRLKNESADIICLVSETLARLYKMEEHIGKDIKQIRKELSEKLQPQVNAVKVKYNLTESGTAGAKVMIELIKALDHDESARPTAIPTGVVNNLVNMAIGSPAICAYRLFNYNEKFAKEVTKKIFVSLFNKAESSAVLDILYGTSHDDSYYESVFRYCVDGNLQAMLDEYAHIIGESEDDIPSAMIDAFSDTASLQIDTLEYFTGTDAEKARLRTHFAVGYFNTRVSNENVQRTEKIRKSFNSPFRPFVLATTSIGQEGLDFHFYCRKIMHWNLPSNPIDIEQREGRINRYKCLAVRQNIAHKYFAEKTWDKMFEKAARSEKGKYPDLVPYWCLTDGEAAKVKIERIVPMYPLSQDCLKYNRLIKVLSLYRLTLGQPRQEELIELINKEITGPIDKNLFMNLSPYDKLNIRLK
jgi:hypothetical protein